MRCVENEICREPVVTYGMPREAGSAETDEQDATRTDRMVISQLLR